MPLLTKAKRLARIRRQRGATARRDLSNALPAKRDLHHAPVRISHAYVRAVAEILSGRRPPGNLPMRLPARDLANHQRFAAEHASLASLAHARASKNTARPALDLFGRTPKRRPAASWNQDQRLFSCRDLSGVQSFKKANDLEFDLDPLIANGTGDPDAYADVFAAADFPGVLLVFFRRTGQQDLDGKWFAVPAQNSGWHDKEDAPFTSVDQVKRANLIYIGPAQLFQTLNIPKPTDEAAQREGTVLVDIGDEE